MLTYVHQNFVLDRGDAEPGGDRSDDFGADDPRVENRPATEPDLEPDRNIRLLRGGSG